MQLRIPAKPPSFQATKSPARKEKSYKSTLNEIEKSYSFAHRAQSFTNSYSNLNQ